MSWPASVSFTSNGLNLANFGGFKQRALTNRASRQLMQRQLTAGPAANDFTFHHTFTFETDMVRIRFPIYNSSANPMSVKSACVSVSNAYGATIAAQYTPSTALWQSLTFGGATSVTVPPGTATNPTKIWSDWFNISSIARTDGGRLQIGMARIVIPTGGFYSYGAVDTTPWNSQVGFTNGRSWSVFRYSGDAGVSSPNSFTAAAVFPNTIFQGFEYDTKVPCLTIAGCGDSIDEGAVDGTNGNFGNGYLWQAVNLLRAQFPTVPIELLDFGVFSSASSTFLQRYQTQIASDTHFDAIHYSPFTPNDGTPTQATTDAECIWLARVSESERLAGRNIILRDGCPNNALGWTAPQDAFRMTLNAQILASSGVLTWSANAVLSDGASPARYIVGTTTDGTHPNELGHGLAAVPCAATIRYLIPA
jgi:hypothetical protein